MPPCPESRTTSPRWKPSACWTSRTCHPSASSSAKKSANCSGQSASKGQPRTRWAHRRHRGRSRRLPPEPSKGHRHQRPGHDRLYVTGDPPPADQLGPAPLTRPRTRLVLVPLATTTPVPSPAMPLPATRLPARLSAVAVSSVNPGYVTLLLPSGRLIKGQRAGLGAVLGARLAVASVTALANEMRIRFVHYHSSPLRPHCRRGERGASQQTRS